jgi:hypothetical protein
MEYNLVIAPRMTSRKYVLEAGFGDGRSAARALRKPGNGRRVSNGHQGELHVEGRRAGRAPGDFIGLHGHAKAFEIARGQFHASSR